MFRSFFLFWALASIGFAGEPFTVSKLRNAISEHISHERFQAATWGIKVASLNSGTTIFETNAFKLLKPASNAKIYTAALALDHFGPEYRLRTSIYSDRLPDEDGTLNGDLVVYGRGDPSFSSRFNDGSDSNVLGPVVSAIKRAGIRSIQGDLVGDDTFFAGPRFGSGWTADDLTYYYGAEVSALSVQDNVIDLFLRPGRIGEPAVLEIKPESDYLHFTKRPVTATNRTSISVYRGLNSREVRISGILSASEQIRADAVTVPDPARWFVTLLRDELAAEGIQVRGQIRTRSWPEDLPADLTQLKELGYAESRPMIELISMMLKPSQNLYAQLLWLHAGAQLKESGRLTEDSGARALGRLLARLGVDHREVMLEEGSGLSRASLVTPNATATLLRAMAKHEYAEIFQNALPEPGEGTLRRRLLDLKGRLRAKTGSLRFVNTLSGYITTEAGERLVFSIILNAYEAGGGQTAARNEIDTIVRFISQLSEKAQ